MSEEQLNQKIQNLAIKDEEFFSLLTKFKSKDPLTKEEQVELSNQLLKLSQVPKNSKIIYELLIDTPKEFLKCLCRIKDKPGNLIVTVLNQNKPTESLIQSLFSNLRLIIKSLESHDDDIAFYLGIYSSLVSHLKTCNPQHLNLFLTYINGKNHEIQQDVFVLLIQNLKLNKEETTSIIKEYLEVLMDDNTLNYNGFLNFVIILEMCFPIVPEICALIYQDDRTKLHLMVRTDSINEGNDLPLAIPILKLIGASCIVENCRNYSVSNYFTFLSHASGINDKEIQVVASLTLGKLWKIVQFEKKKTDISTQSLAEILITYVQEPESQTEYIELAVEGLMYLSLYWEVRDMMRMDVLLIETLLTKLEETSINLTHLHTSLQYGLLSIISNLTRLKDINDRETNMNTRKKLQSMATPKNGSDSDEEDQEAIKLFNRELLNDDKLISKIATLKSYKSSASSNNSLNEVIKIIYHLSSDQHKSTRVELVKQGGLNIVINYLISFSEINKKDNLVISTPNTEDSNVIECRTFATRSLARMLISVDPKTSFTKYDTRTSIPFLKELLGPDISQYNNSTSSGSTISNNSYLHDMTLLDRFESLLALTNIASSASSELKNFLIHQLFDSYLDNFIISSQDIKIQQASFELIANLINESLMLAKFFNLQIPANAKRLDLLIKLLLSTNAQLQLVIAGIFTNATDFDIIAESLVNNSNILDELIHAIVEILMNQIKEAALVVQTSYFLVNLVYAAANNSDPNVIKKLTSSDDLKSGCANVLRSDNNDAKEAIMEVIKICKFN